MMEPITATILAAALGKGLHDVGKFVLETWGPIVARQAQEKGLVEPAVEPVRKVVQRRATRPQRSRELEKAMERALAAAGAPSDDDTDLDRWLKGVGLDRLTARQNEALRRQFARAVVGFVDAEADPPQELMVALAWPRPQRQQLAVLLTTFRLELYNLEEWRPLLEYANETAKLGLLKKMNAAFARLDEVFVETEQGEALRVVVVEQGLSAGRASVIEQRYRADVVRDLRMHDFRGIVQIKRPVRLPLADIYVELGLLSLNSHEEQRRIQERMLRLNEEERLAQEEQRLRDRVTDALARSQRLVVLGEPGSGKTTSLRFIALMLAYGYGAARLGFSTPYIPVLVRMADYARVLETRPALALDNFLLDVIAQQYASDPQLSDFLRLALDQGACMVLLDGLDEVGDDPVRGRSLRTRVVQQVDRFANRWCDDRNNRVLVSSRIEGYWDEALRGFDHVQLSPLQPPDEVRDLLLRWYTAYEQVQDTELPFDIAYQRAQSSVDELLPRAMAWPSVRRLATNPLLLTILALIHETLGRLPNRRIKLYEIAAQTLIESWRQAQVGMPSQLLTELEEETIIRVMAPLAYWLHAEHPGGTASLEEWRTRLIEVLVEPEGFEESEAGKIAGRFLHHARYETGLLAERGLGQFGFFHLTFEEYLTAREIARQREHKRRQMLRTHWEDPRWHEVILLAAGQLGIVETRQDDVSQYILDLLQMEAEDKQNKGRQVVLAGRAVVDIGPRSINPKAKQWLTEALCETMQDMDPTSKGPYKQPQIEIRTRFDAGVALDELGWLPADLNAWLKVGGKRADGNKKEGFLAMKYPVTNAQFERFILAGGYENPAWWSDLEQARNLRETFKHPEYWHSPQFGRERRGFPVVGITWYEAEAYSNWLSDVLRRARSEDVDLASEDKALVAELLAHHVESVRLPTLQEWQRMAGGTEVKDRYPWDSPDGLATTREEALLARANIRDSGIRTTSPVALYPLGKSRPYGLMDMAGNVWEWTLTQEQDVSAARVLCGGSWSLPPHFARVSVHNWNPRHNSNYNVGCRLVSPIVSGF